MNVDKPAPPTGTRRPWDDVLAAFAARTGRPLWTVTRCKPSDEGRRNATGQRRAA